jgi:branched-chain amino acid aminotransferase
MNYFNYNGKFFSEGEPVIPADSRALRYGDGLFETIKVKNGLLEMEDEHFARLWNGMQTLQFDIPRHFTPDKLQSEIIALLKKNQQEGNVRVRLCVFRGEGGLFDAKNHLPNYIIQSWPLPDNSGEFNSNGLVLGIYEAAKKSCDILSNLKHNNYLPYILAALKAKQEKWNDAIILNSYGRICDTTIANIFLIKEGVIYTPSLKEGCIAGTMRKKIIRESVNNNHQLIETEITLTDLQHADEVFLSNSIYNIRWVQRIDDTSYSNSLTQKIYKEIFATIL